MSMEFREPEKRKKRTVIEKTVKSGVSFGSALAMVISYAAWHSVAGRSFMDCWAGFM